MVVIYQENASQEIHVTLSAIPISFHEIVIAEIEIEIVIEIVIEIEIEIGIATEIFVVEGIKIGIVILIASGKEIGSEIEKEKETGFLEIGNVRIAIVNEIVSEKGIVPETVCESLKVSEI